MWIPGQQISIISKIIEKQILGTHLRFAETEDLGMGLSHCVLVRSSGHMVCIKRTMINEANYFSNPYTPNPYTLNEYSPSFTLGHNNLI